MAMDITGQVLDGSTIDLALDEAMKSIADGQIDLSLTAQNEVFDLAIGNAVETGDLIKQLQNDALQKKMRDIAKANAIRAKHSMF